MITVINSQNIYHYLIQGLPILGPDDPERGPEGLVGGGCALEGDGRARHDVQGAAGRLQDAGPLPHHQHAHLRPGPEDMPSEFAIMLQYAFRPFGSSEIKLTSAFLSRLT
jgi:hypothetical protein